MGGLVSGWDFFFRWKYLLTDTNCWSFLFICQETLFTRVNQQKSLCPQEAPKSTKIKVPNRSFKISLKGTKKTPQTWQRKFGDWICWSGILCFVIRKNILILLSFTARCNTWEYFLRLAGNCLTPTLSQRLQALKKQTKTKKNKNCQSYVFMVLFAFWVINMYPC